jgi:hypothetical protein
MVEPISTTLATGGLLEIEKTLIDKGFFDFRDAWLITKFRWHVYIQSNLKRDNTKKIVDDFLDFKARLTEAISDADYKRMQFLLYVMLSRCDKITKMQSLSLSLSMEESIVNFSKDPNIIENSLFVINLWIEKYYSDWDKVYHPQFFPNGDGFFPTHEPQIAFTDPSFMAASYCLGFFYRICIECAELSQGSIIRVGNFLLMLVAGENRCIQNCPMFNRIFLSIMLQIAAKAKSQNIEPIHEKIVSYLKQNRNEILESVFDVAEGKVPNPFSQMGNISIFLATKDEIQYIKREIYSDTEVSYFC